MSSGVLYFAKGATFRREATLSARRVKELMPRYPITIVADRDVDAECFDTVLLDSSEFRKRNKPQAMGQTPYDRTIYLDTDVYLEEPIDELFDLLEEFDVALRRNKSEVHSRGVGDGDPNAAIPEAFPEFNTGVIPYRKSAAVEELLREWERLCLPEDDADQRAFRPALYHSSVRVAPLPNRYNCMYRNDNLLNKRVKAFHGPLLDRDKNEVDLREARRKLNRSTDCRLYYVYGNTLFVEPSPPLLLKPWYRLSQLWDLARARGVRAVTGMVLRKVAGGLTADRYRGETDRRERESAESSTRRRVPHRRKRHSSQRRRG